MPRKDSLSPEAYERSLAYNREYKRQNRKNMSKGTKQQLSAQTLRAWWRNHCWLAWEKTSLGCMDCDERNPVVLDFDHVHGNKKFNIAQHGTKSRRTIGLEMVKCEIVCSNCHRIRTYDRKRN